MPSVLLNTLYVTTQDAYVSKEHESLLVKVERVERLRIPRHHLEGVVCFGRVGVSPDALAACGEDGIAVTFLTEGGRFLAKLEGTRQGGIVLRRAQHRAADDPARVAALARSFVLGKVANTRTFVQRVVRDGEEAYRSEGEEVVRALAEVMQRLPKQEDPDVIRGLEGEAAARYFQWFARALRTKDEGLVFRGRSRRPPRDPINALLSFGYALLMHDCVAALASVGLDPDLGFLHDERPGRPSLALDLMEELRVAFVDRMVVAMVNRGQVRSSEFVEREGGGVEMSDAMRKAFLMEYQQRKQECVTHPFTGSEVRWGMVAMVQARLLARAVRGELDVYPPFALR
jgi:CRISPR-associated protein Cas1